AHEHELPIPEAVRILRDVCDALAYAHGRGIVHRDIKPDNVLLSGKHSLVTDFGVAKAVAESTGKTALTSMGVALGTPAYMAPEQAAADPSTDHRADIYAVGALAYEMLAGRPPFTAPTVQAVLAAHVSTPPAAVLGGVYFLTNQLGLPGWVLRAAIGLLAVGLPVTVATGLVERRRALARAAAPPAAGLHAWLTWRKALTSGVLAFAALGLVA